MQGSPEAPATGKNIIVVYLTRTQWLLREYMCTFLCGLSKENTLHWLLEILLLLLQIFERTLQMYLDQPISQSFKQKLGKR